MADTKQAAAPGDSRQANQERTLYAYFQGKFVPFAEANISIATHAFQYGTGCFEGIRAYYNRDKDAMFVLKLREHYERIHRSCRILRINPGLSVDAMCDVTLELLRMNDFKEDVYIRPVAYKASQVIGLKLTGLEDAFAIYCVPMGDYIDTQKGLHCMVAAWARPKDTMLPVRAKLTGAYVNACLASDDARINGFDEAIMLTQDGFVSEGSSCNLFMVRSGKLATTTVTDSILEGITRSAIFELAAHLGYEVEVRRIDRSELYIADELFFVGTGVQVSPITKVDHRPIGDGNPGKITLELQNAYFNAVRGNDEAFKHWLVQV